MMQKVQSEQVMVQRTNGRCDAYFSHTTPGNKNTTSRGGNRYLGIKYHYEMGI